MEPEGWFHGWALPPRAIGRGGLQPAEVSSVSSLLYSSACAAALGNAHLRQGKMKSGTNESPHSA